MKNYRHIAFTLTELLVVVMIVAVLAAVLFPIFTLARERAAASACIANEKMLGLAFIQYQQDNDQKFPSGNAFATPNGFSKTVAIPGAGWAGQVFKYVKTRSTFTCPDDATVSTLPNWANADGNDLQEVSYAFNSNFARLRSGGVTSAANSVLLFEVQQAMANPTNPGESVSPSGNFDAQSPAQLANWNSANSMQSYGAATVGALGGQCTINQVLPRHGQGSNFVMADAHVVFLLGNVVSAGATAANSTDDQTWDGATANCPAILDAGKSGHGPLQWASGAASGASFHGKSAKTGGALAATFSPK